MKKIFFALSFAAMVASCCSDAGMKVEVKNSSSNARTLETVELAWGDVTAKLADVTPDNVIVMLDGQQVPSQVMFTDGDSAKPATLIFQATVGAGAAVSYDVAVGVKEEYEQQAFSRYIPERKDDYAWENNVIAQRVYGQALSDEVHTPGVDVWSKSVSDLVVDKWYGIGHYHKDAGEGMDCYKVASTLGGGASAPMVGVDDMLLSGNWYGWTRTANGPIRTEFTLTYEPFMVGDKEVSIAKTYSLDANTHFSKVVDVYTGNFSDIDVAIGSIIHTADAPQLTDGTVIAVYEPASDDQYKSGCSIGVGVIVPGAADGALEIRDHKVKTRNIKAGEPSVYYVGTGWSGGGMPTAQSWFDCISTAAAAVAEPLTVTIK
ncbi:MAG: DUF4861 family protein [Rikenellaceae bacterium]